MSIDDGGDPLIRFAHIEAGEACSNVFFSQIAPVAEALAAKTGIEVRYFGRHHLDREPGHVRESPGVFDDIVLDERQRPIATALAARMFDLVEEMLDCFVRYAETYLGQGKTPRRPKGLSPRHPQGGAEAGRPAPEAERQGMTALYHADVKRVLLEREERAAKHPFYRWLRDEPSLDPQRKLLRFLPMWIGDVMGYRDLLAYAIRYPDPRREQERLINRWCDDLETRSALFLHDLGRAGSGSTPRLERAGHPRVLLPRSAGGRAPAPQGDVHEARDEPSEARAPLLAPRGAGGEWPRVLRERENARAKGRAGQGDPARLPGGIVTTWPTRRGGPAPRRRRASRASPSRTRTGTSRSVWSRPSSTPSKGGSRCRSTWPGRTGSVFAEDATFQDERPPHRLRPRRWTPPSRALDDQGTDALVIATRSGTGGRAFIIAVNVAAAFVLTSARTSAAVGGTVWKSNSADTSSGPAGTATRYVT